MIFVIVNIEDEENRRDDRDDDKDDPFVPEKSKGNSGIVNQGHMQNIANEGQRFSQGQHFGEINLGQPVGDDDEKNGG